jgi:carboxyl-terminal processing protease
MQLQASALLKLTPECAPVALESSERAGDENRNLIISVVKLLKAHYVEPITPESEMTMSRGAVQGMVDSLSDPDSRFLEPGERELLDDASAGRFHGTGAVIALKNEKQDNLEIARIIVVSPMPGSPAEKAGLETGDSITHIDGKWIITHDPFKEKKLEDLAKAARNKEIDEFTYQKAYEATYQRLKEGISLSDALEILTAKSSGEIALRVERPNYAAPVEIKMTCRDTKVDPVSYRQVKPGIAYIRITQFGKRSPEEFAAQLDRARKGRAGALILDLRGNPGGLMDAAVEIASKLTGGGVIAKIADNKSYRAITRPKTRGVGLPLVVLIDGGTSSVAELVAGTLREYASATLVGTRTFGDGLTQTPLILRDGSAAVVTTGKMFTAKGADFSDKGITPDREVAWDKAHGDAQLEEAESILSARMGKT